MSSCKESRKLKLKIASPISMMFFLILFCTGLRCKNFLKSEKSLEFNPKLFTLKYITNQRKYHSFLSHLLEAF